MTDKNYSTPSRRAVLKSAGVGMAGFVGVTGTSGAAEVGVDEQQAAQLDAPHDSVADAAAVLEDHGGDLLAALSQADVLPAATVSELDAERLLSYSEHVDGREGLFSSVTTLAEPTSRVTLRKRVGDRVVELLVHPEAGDHYAVVRSEDYSDATIVRPEDLDSDAQDGDVGTNADYVGYSCEIYIYSDCSYDFYPWFVDDSGCYKGSRSGCCSEGYKPRPC